MVVLLVVAIITLGYSIIHRRNRQVAVQDQSLNKQVFFKDVILGAIEDDDRNLWLLLLNSLLLIIRVTLPW